MTWIDLLTSLEGRISRKAFWIALLPLVAIEIGASYVWGERQSAIASLILAYPEFAVLAKRGHDRNVPTWIPGLFIAGAAVLNLLALFDLVGSPASPNTVFYVLAIPIGIGGLVLLVDFGFRRGTDGPNQYGPDPLAAQ